MFLQYSPIYVKNARYGQHHFCLVCSRRLLLLYVWWWWGLRLPHLYFLCAHNERRAHVLSGGLCRAAAILSASVFEQTRARRVSHWWKLGCCGGLLEHRRCGLACALRSCLPPALTSPTVGQSVARLILCVFIDARFSRVVGSGACIYRAYLSGDFFITRPTRIFSACVCFGFIFARLDLSRPPRAAEFRLFLVVFLFQLN